MKKPQMPGPAVTHETADARSQASHSGEQPDYGRDSQAATPPAIQPAGGVQRIRGRVDLAQLQRVLGNRRVSQLLSQPGAAATPPPQVGAASGEPVIQRKPADINADHILNYDNTGALLNTAADRATLKRATIINAQLRDGWVLPKEELIGGHLFKREFGGADNESNVVPWKEETEEEFTEFETEYTKAANQAAQDAIPAGTGFQATVHTEATFVDRPDLLLSEGDLDTAGWDLANPDRKKRQAQYADVAEQFSGIPTNVKVEVLNVPGFTKSRTYAGTAIAPAYTRNDEAIKPAYVVPKRFKRNATEPKNFIEVANMKEQTNEQRKRLTHVASNHPDHFNIPFTILQHPDKPPKKQAQIKPELHLKALQTELKAIVDTGEQIIGVYRKVDVLHYVIHATKMWVCTDTAGIIVAAFRLSSEQYDTLITEGKVA